MPNNPEKQLLGLDLQQLTAVAQEWAQPVYRGRQLFEAVYRQRVASLEEITTLPREFRRQLQSGYSVGALPITKKFQSVDRTIRYLIGLHDGELVETVWMPEGDGGEAGSMEGWEETQDPSTRLGKSGPDSLGMTSKNGAAPRRRSETRQPPRHRGGASGTRQPPETASFDRATICVSSQVGCAVNCQFCMTALLGVKRNLTAGEIVGQILTVLRERQPELESAHAVESGRAIPRLNLVFMGMGEPFLNYQNFMQAVRLLVEGVGLAPSRMTVSTAGIVPRISEFGNEPTRPKLAISLNASNNELRDRLMPINRKWNLETLVRAAREFPLRPRERLTFEYVLLEDVNDQEQNAREVAGLLRGLRAKVNLIALNPGPEIPFGTPSEERVLRFQEVLVRAGIPTFIRRPRGRDIYAACGQLKKSNL